MERRKKGSGQITYVEGRKSPWRASITDSTGKQKSRFFKTEKEARAFLREINADVNKMKALLETGVSFSSCSGISLGVQEVTVIIPSISSTSTSPNGKLGVSKFSGINAYPSGMIKQSLNIS